MAAALVLAALPAAAQSPRVEITGLVGWTYSDGVDGDGPILAGDGNIYNEIGPKDSASWGLGIGVNATDNVEIGFLYGQQLSQVEIKGTRRREVGDVTITSYHPYVAFNLTPADASLRPYLLIGFGATNYGKVTVHRPPGRTRDVRRNASTQGTFGAGVKIFASNVGLRLGAQWTPHLHQVRLRRLVVRPVLGLLRRWRRPVLQPVPVERRRHPSILTLTGAGRGFTLRLAPPDVKDAGDGC